MSQAHPQPPATAGSAKLVVVALLLALAAVALTNVYITMVQNQARERTFNVFVLNRTVRPGDRLRDRDYEPVAVPMRFREQFAKLGVMTEDDLAARRNDPVERTGAQSTLVRYDLFIPPEGSANVDKIEPGMRLVSLPIDSNQQPGNLRPEMHVDIIAPFETGGDIPEMLTVMENVRLVAVGRYTATEQAEGTRSRRISGYRNFTIMVKPDVAKKLAMIQGLAKGEFQLLIRKPGDLTVPKIPEGEVNPRLDEMLRTRLPALPGGELGF